MSHQAAFLLFFLAPSSSSPLSMRRSRLICLRYIDLGRLGRWTLSLSSLFLSGRGDRPKVRTVSMVGHEPAAFFLGLFFSWPSIGRGLVDTLRQPCMPEESRHLLECHSCRWTSTLVEYHRGQLVFTRFAVRSDNFFSKRYLLN
jgi:hypothetical protein